MMKSQIQLQLISKDYLPSQSPMNGCMLSRSYHLKIAQTIVGFVAISMMQLKAGQQWAVFFLVFIAVQSSFTVAEVTISVVEK
jgi:hypothetical protein